MHCIQLLLPQNLIAEFLLKLINLHLVQSVFGASTIQPKPGVTQNIYLRPSLPSTSHALETRSHWATVQMDIEEEFRSSLAAHKYKNDCMSK